MPHRRIIDWVGKRANILITGLLLLSLGLAIVAISGYSKAANAQDRLNVLAVERAQEEVGKRVADVATCFNRARSRPQLILVLRGIAGQLADGDARRAALSVVTAYENDTPSRADCIALAKKLEVDAKPYLEQPEPDGIGNIPQR